MSPQSGKWTSVSVAGHVCHTYLPPEPGPHGYTVIYLHGVHLAQLHDKQPFLDQFDRHGLRVIAPVTQRSWWSDRICAEFDPQISAEQYVLDHVMTFIKEQWGCVPPQVGLLGTSMGGQGALRLAYKYPNRFPVAAAISPAIDHQQRLVQGDETLSQMYRDAEEIRQDTATLHIHPLNWPRHQFFCCDPVDRVWHESAERLRMKLASLGVPYDADLETSGGGHDFAYYNLMAEAAVGFIADRLDKERRRVE